MRTLCRVDRISSNWFHDFQNRLQELSARAKGPVTDPPSPAGPGLPPSPSPPPTLPPQPPAPCGQVAGGSAAVGFPETLEALRVVGRLSDRHGDLEERVETLEAELARLDDLAKHASGAAGNNDGRPVSVAFMVSASKS